jgi:hypothetical protein
LHFMIWFTYDPLVTGLKIESGSVNFVNIIPGAQGCRRTSG